MVQSAATSVDEYLRDLPDDRRAVIATLRSLIRKNLPKGFRETMASGMIAYGVPLERYPDTYNGQPLCYVALAAQKSYFSLYLMGVYQDQAEEARLREEFAKAGKKPDMGKSCVRFRSLDDLPLEAIGRLVAGTTPDAFIARYEASRRRVGPGGSGRRIRPPRRGGL